MYVRQPFGSGIGNCRKQCENAGQNESDGQAFNVVTSWFEQYQTSLFNVLRAVVRRRLKLESDHTLPNRCDSVVIRYSFVIYFAQRNSKSNCKHKS